MDISKFFGNKLAERMIWKFSSTVEEFYYNVDDAYASGRPFIYVGDSESSLSSDAEEDKFQENKKDFRKGKKLTGSFGDGKARKHSANLRQVVNKLEKSGSILLLVSQSRDNIGFGSQFTPETRSGGRALTFYATAEIWMKELREIQKTIRGQKEKIGSYIQVNIKKNRDTGREPRFELYHYISTGLADTDAMVEFLIKRSDRNGWKESDNKVTAPDFDFTGSREELIQKIESEKLTTELKLLTSGVWKEIEEACKVERKSRYS